MNVKSLGKKTHSEDSATLLFTLVFDSADAMSYSRAIGLLYL